MTQTSKQILLAEIEDFPALPAVTTRVMQVAGNPESTAHDLMEAIRPDPGLTLKILKIANSALYGRIRETASLEEAVVVLGFKEVRNLVMTSAVFNTFSRLKKVAPFDIGEFWKHAFLCGLASRIVGREAGLPGNEMFIIGLIHDIGKLVICMVLPEDFSRILKGLGPNELRTLTAERDILDITHDEVGGRLLKRWLFPERMVMAVRYHHDPAKSRSEPLSSLALHLADHLTHTAGCDETPEQGGIMGQPAPVPPHIEALVHSHGLQWDVPLRQRLQDELASQIAQQSHLLGLLFS